MTASAAPGLDVQRFDPVVPWTERVAVRGAPRFLGREWTVSLSGSYAAQPLELGYRAADRASSVVDSLIGGELSAGVLLSRRLSVGVHLPVLQATVGTPPIGVSTALGGGSGGVGPGDMGLSGFYLPISGVAVGACLSLPTGRRTAFLGGTGFAFRLDVSGEREQGRAVLAGDLGLVFRTGAVEAVGLLPSHELTLGLAAALHLDEPGTWTVGAELVAATVLQRAFSPSHSPAEIWATLDVDPEGPLRFGVGAGPGLTPGFGSPDGRVFARVVVESGEPRDPDGDGLFRGDDLCPFDAEDLDGFEDHDGCPERDAAELRMGEEVYFAVDSAEVRSVSRPVLSGVLDLLEGQPSLHVRVLGHQDASEAEPSLSRRRAEAVVVWLSARGISSDRLKALDEGTVGAHGATGTPAAPSRNQRADVIVVDGSQR